MAEIHRQNVSFILSKQRFKNIEDAIAWVTERGFANVPEETSTSFRFPQRDSNFFKSNTFRSLKVAEGVTQVTALPRKRKEK